MIMFLKVDLNKVVLRDGSKDGLDLPVTYEFKDMEPTVGVWLNL